LKRGRWREGGRKANKTSRGGCTWQVRGAGCD
jgi:hypothetical protein